MDVLGRTLELESSTIVNELSKPASRSNKRQGDRGPTRMDGGAATSRLVLALRASTTYE